MDIIDKAYSCAKQEETEFLKTILAELVASRRKLLDNNVAGYVGLFIVITQLEAGLGLTPSITEILA